MTCLVVWLTGWFDLILEWMDWLVAWSMHWLRRGSILPRCPPHNNTPLPTTTINQLTNPKTPITTNTTPTPTLLHQASTTPPSAPWPSP
jgi:predicted component of type VI protein secretion system